MKKNYFFCLPFVLMAMLTMNSLMAQSILFVGTAENADDELLQERIAAFGEEPFTVTFVAGPDFAADYTEASAYEGYDLLFISESISSGNSNAYGQAGFPIPAFVSEPYMMNKADVQWGALDEDNPQVDVLPSMEIVNGGHPITAGVYQEMAEVQILESTEDSTFQYEVLPDVALTITELGVPVISSEAQAVYSGGPSWFVIHDDQTYGDGLTIPAGSEIVVYGFHSGTALNGTDDYWTQVSRSVLYLLDQLPDLPTAVDKEFAKGLNVYPNPTADKTFIKYSLETPASVTVELDNLNGQLVKAFELGQRNSGENIDSIDLTGLNPGIYIYNIQIGDQVQSGRIVKH